MGRYRHQIPQVIIKEKAKKMAKLEREMFPDPVPMPPSDYSVITARDEAVQESIDDPGLFAEVYLGHQLWGKQLEILESIATKSKTAVKACHASGKCMYSMDHLTLADGSRVLARDLVGEKFELLTRTDEGITKVEAFADWNIGEDVYELLTESGRRVIRNAQHPFWCATGYFPAGNRCKIRPLGWTPLCEMKVGTLVAVTEEFPHEGKEDLPVHEIKLLAYLIGDGGYTADGVIFSQSVNSQLTEFIECCSEMGMVVTHRGNYDYAVTSQVGQPTRNGHRVNLVAELLETHKLRKKHSRDKRIPAAIFSLPKKSLALFLNRLYSTDGWACIKGAAPQIGFCSASVGMIRDLQELLVRFGIGSRIYEKENVNAWTLDIAAAYDTKRFCEEIGIYGKEQAVEDVLVAANRQLSTNQVRKWRWKQAPSGTRWERVVSVCKYTEDQTVAITVPNNQTYLTMFWEHNTFCAAVAVLWWLARYKRAAVITTAPTDLQVRKLLWGEIAASLATSRYPFPKATQTELRIEPKRYALGFATSVTEQNQGVRFQGFHEDHILVILDEAPGVHPGIWGAIQGIKAGGHVSILALGNPTISSGKFYDAFGKDRNAFNCITISAFDTPNLEGLTISDLLRMEIEAPEELNVIKSMGLTNRSWVLEMYHEWGPDNPLYQARVLGEFPTQSEYSLISLEWLEKAKNAYKVARDRKEAIEGDIFVGLDVAGPGEDETAVCIRQGNQILKVKGWSKPDPSVELAHELREYEGRIKTFNVDCIGAGWGIYLQLKRDFGRCVVPVNVGASSVVEIKSQNAVKVKKFVNLKAEFYWGLRELFEKGVITGDLDDKTCAQLSGIRWEPTDKGQIAIEKKKDAQQKRGMKSPDRAEAVMLAFANPEVAGAGVLEFYRDMTKGARDARSDT